MEEISLIVENQTFIVKKELLCEYSDYFRAMFSGSFVENKQKEITIDVIDAYSLNMILQYMNIGLIDLSEYSLTTIGDLAMAANFLQISELIKQIEYTLEIQLSHSNWLETMAVAENASYSQLEQLSAAFGLFSFKYMEPKYIPSIHKLYWYLSHPYLDTKSELDVFEFGLNWVLHSETGADGVLVVLTCLDVTKLTSTDLVKIKKLLKDFENSLPSRVVDCLLELFLENDDSISPALIIEKKTVLCENFTERVYTEVLNLVEESKSRLLRLVPVLPVWALKDGRPEFVPHCMYTFSEESGFEKWLEVAEKNLWGWNVIAWDPMRLVVVCGEHGRGTGIFMRDVKVYDTLKKEWIQHGVQLPPRRHGGLAVAGDSLFIVGGVGGFRVVLDSAIIYNLKERTYRKIANFPDAIQNPAVCTHNNQVYAAGHDYIYRYEESGDVEQWVRVVGTEIRMSCMISYKDAVYCTQNFFSYLYMFRPNLDEKLEIISCFNKPPAAVCNLGNRLLFFTRTLCGESDTVTVEEYQQTSTEKKAKVIWRKSDMDILVNEVAGSCCLTMTMPPLCKEISQYHRKYLSKYPE